MTTVKFWKMHGLGNDFVVFDNRAGKLDDSESANLAVRLCERRFSVGADGLLLLSNSSVADVRMRVFNADGSEAEMCGNGIRCFAKYCYENNIVSKKEMAVETLAGVKQTGLTTKHGSVTSVSVDMGKPTLERSALPMSGEGNCINEPLSIEGIEYRITCLTIGNPHCVIFVDNVEEFPVQQVGPRIENHKLFPKKTNVEFAQVVNKNELKLRVWERGCGETLACGTGACAAVVAGTLLQKVGNKVIVHLLGGDLTVEYSERLLLNGPAERVFEGKLFEDAKKE